MNNLSNEQVQRLVRKVSAIGHYPSLYGHAFARSARELYLHGRLQIVSVADLRSFKRQDDETDLSTPASICTYNELVTVSLNKDFTVTVFIKESMVSLRAHPSQPRVNFTLSGDWWAINNGSEGLPEAIESAFSSHAARLFAHEEVLRKQKRCEEIEAQLLSGTYNPQ